MPQVVRAQRQHHLAPPHQIVLRAGNDERKTQGVPAVGTGEGHRLAMRRIASAGHTARRSLARRWPGRDGSSRRRRVRRAAKPRSLRCRSPARYCAPVRAGMHALPLLLIAGVSALTGSSTAARVKRCLPAACQRHGQNGLHRRSRPSSGSSRAVVPEQRMRHHHQVRGPVAILGPRRGLRPQSPSAGTARAQAARILRQDLGHRPARSSACGRSGRLARILR